MSLRGLLFDLDGTLIDSRDDIAAAANHLRALMGKEPLSLELVGSYIGDGIEALVRRVIDADADRDVGVETELFRKRYHDHCVEKTFAYPEVAATLAELKARGYAMAVVTNKPERISSRILGLLGLAPYFGAVIGGNTASHKKPHPAPLYEACERLGVDRASAWMIGDSRVDAEAAKNAGMPCAGILGGIGDEGQLRRASPALILPGFKALLDHFPACQP